MPVEGGGKGGLPDNCTGQKKAIDQLARKKNDFSQIENQRTTSWMVAERVRGFHFFTTNTQDLSLRRNIRGLSVSSRATRALQAIFDFSETTS